MRDEKNKKYIQHGKATKAWCLHKIFDAVNSLIAGKDFEFQSRFILSCFMSLSLMYEVENDINIDLNFLHHGIWKLSVCK